jgi:hypothetical protein
MIQDARDYPPSSLGVVAAEDIAELAPRHVAIPQEIGTRIPLFRGRWELDGHG